jgi:hypothetical protein
MSHWSLDAKETLLIVMGAALIVIRILDVALSSREHPDDDAPLDP